MKNITKKKKYNTNLIKARRSYTLAEIAELYNIHTRTVQSWRKDGLGVIDMTSKPYLVIGSELKRFLKEKAKKRKHKLQIGEFFCPKCQAPRKSLPEHFKVEITNKKLGKTYKQAFIKGICQVCGQHLLLFSSDRKIEELQRNGLLLQEHKAGLYSNRNSSMNTDITKGAKC